LIFNSSRDTSCFEYIKPIKEEEVNEVMGNNGEEKGGNGAPTYLMVNAPFKKQKYDRISLF